MTDAEATALVAAKLQELGPETVIALDVPRVWATGVQSFVRPDYTMLIFREHNLMQFGDPPQDQAAIKNVASLVLPTYVARGLHKALGDQLATIGNDADAG